MMNPARLAPLGVVLSGLLLALAPFGAAGEEAASPAQALAAFPLSAFSALGGAIVRDSHIANLGWDEAQSSSFIGGERAFFAGKGLPFDDEARRLSEEMRHRVNGLAAGDISAAKTDQSPSAAPVNGFPNSAFAAIGSSFAQKTHLAELGVAEAQVSALLEGQRAVFRGRQVAFNDDAERLIQEINRLMGILEASRHTQTAEPAAGPDAAPAAVSGFPLSAYAAIGSMFAKGNHLADLGWSQAQINAFIDGERATFQGGGYPFDDPAQKLFAEVNKHMSELDSAALRPAPSPAVLSKDRLKKLYASLGLREADSGLYYRIQFGRQGIRPGPDDTVILTCAATTANDNKPLPQLSFDHARVKIASLLPGLQEGFQMMTIESTATFLLPPALSFGNGQWPDGIERGAQLIFKVTLHDVVNIGDTK